MRYLLYFTFCFMIFEAVKLLMLEDYWDASINRGKSPFLVVLEFFYMVFIAVLFFVHYWYIGLTIFIVSVITGYQVMDDVMEKTKYNDSIRRYLSTDSIVSILLLSVIIFKELSK